MKTNYPFPKKIQGDNSREIIICAGWVIVVI